jgi:hypothetical protein
LVAVKDTLEGREVIMSKPGAGRQANCTVRQVAVLKMSGEKALQIKWHKRDPFWVDLNHPVI